MTTKLLATVLIFSTFAVLSDPVSVLQTCPVCKGKRSLSLTPPNLGQYDGEIGVTPGKAFTSHRWDVKHDRCPICNGVGRREVYKTRVPPPAPETVEGLEKCPECRWAGVTPCRKCLSTGLLPCSACKSAAKGGKPGWIKTEKSTSGSSKRHTKIIVSPCGSCGGIGKTVCPDCLGKGAVNCRKCSGIGGVPKKERK